MSTPPPNSKFDLHVAPDRLLVMLGLREGISVTAAEVIAALRELEVKSFDDGVIIAALERRALETMTLAIATGTPAIDERPGRIEYRVPMSGSDGLVITRVEVGQVIAKIAPNVPGKPGRDVFGKPIEPLAATQVQMGNGVALNNGEITSTARGSVGVRNGTLSVEPLMEVAADHHGPIEFEGDLIVKGALENGRTVRASGSLLVGGTVDAADVRVKGAMQVKGGLIGRGKGRCMSGGDLWCRFISGSSLHVQGSVHVQGDITNAQIVAFKAVDAPRGHIYGGHIVANGGVSCKTLGNDSGTATRIEVGSEAALSMITAAANAEIDAYRTRVRQIREKIGPLMQQLKFLTHQQREKATELLAQASETEERAEQIASELNDRLAQMRASESATVVVSDAAFAGVTIRINGLETALSTSFKGPLTFSAAKVGRVTQIVMTEADSGTQTPLPTYAAQAHVAARRPTRAPETLRAAA